MRKSKKRIAASFEFWYVILIIHLNTIHVAIRQLSRLGLLYKQTEHHQRSIFQR